MDNTASIRAGYNLRTFCSEVVVLVASAFVLSIASPGFMSANGVWPFAFIALIPVFAVIRHTSWKVIWLFGFLFGFIFQVFFSYWLMELGVDRETALADACRIEHVLSAESFAAIKNHINKRKKSE